MTRRHQQYTFESSKRNGKTNSVLYVLYVYGILYSEYSNKSQSRIFEHFTTRKKRSPAFLGVTSIDRTPDFMCSISYSDQILCPRPHQQRALPCWAAIIAGLLKCRLDGSPLPLAPDFPEPAGRLATPNELAALKRNQEAVELVLVILIDTYIHHHHHHHHRDPPL